ncbi:rhodanese-like domain-containing protein [Candidatus Nomurabacteria bacterium]|nr:rhodanese-like domain-containing protein [Candidatus Nomurabacteria bacterium]
MNLRHNNNDLIILDVRTPDEFVRGHIEGAVNIDYFSDDFQDKLVCTLDKESKLLVCCGSGRRSREAMDILKELGYSNLQNLEGGLAAWAGDLVT